MTVYSILWAVNLELNSVLGNEGRAGMTAIVDDPQLDLSTLAKRLSTALPAYARPVFVRLLSKMDTTGGFLIQNTLLTLYRCVVIMWKYILSFVNRLDTDHI